MEELLSLPYLLPSGRWGVAIAKREGSRTNFFNAAGELEPGLIRYVEKFNTPRIAAAYRSQYRHLSRTPVLLNIELVKAREAAGAK
jgi:hypothetical protein